MPFDEKFFKNVEVNNCNLKLPFCKYGKDHSVQE